MIPRYLITTANLQTWKTNEPVIFLGEWCKLYLEKNSWSKLDYKTASYHWDDRKRLYTDYLYLLEFYERLLPSVADSLNQFHSVDRPLRYWRILIGPWLSFFIQMLFDRWQMVSRTLSECEITGTTILNIDDELILPQDFQDFYQMYDGDFWNHWVYGRAIEKIGTLPIDRLDLKLPEYKIASYGASSGLAQRNVTRKIGFSIKAALNKLGVIARSNKYFFINSGLGRFQQAKLEISLRQFPTFFSSPKLPKIQFDRKGREFFKVEFEVSSTFESFVKEMICCQIPRYYLEGFNALNDVAKRVAWPKKPLVIFTASSAILNDVFKCWAADKVANGSKLVLGQHGGQYGVAKWEFVEELELGVSDAYFTWGWRREGAVPLPAGKLVNISKKMRANSEGCLALIQGVLPRYSYRMFSVPIASQFENYIKEQERFVESLSDNIKDNLIIRLTPDDKGWGLRQRWVDKFPKVNFDSLDHTIERTISKSRLCIVTFNTTTFLETLAANVPTIIFWNPSYWEVRESAKDDYDKLRDAGILHDNPELAAKKVKEVWGDVNEWWTQSHVQSIRESFCRKYARTESNWLNQWKGALQKISKIKN